MGGSQSEGLNLCLSEELKLKVYMNNLLDPVLWDRETRTKEVDILYLISWVSLSHNTPDLFHI